MKPLINKSRCQECNFCEKSILCPGEDRCIGCGACVDACPARARYLIEDKTEFNNVSCVIDGEIIEIKEQ